MRVRKWMRLALCTVLIAALFAGCGASSKSESAMMDMASPGAPMAAGSNTAGDYMVAETMAAAESLQEESSTQAAPPGQPEIYHHREHVRRDRGHGCSYGIGSDPYR